MVTVNYPQTSTTFIDRFLASAEAYRVPVVLIFNKTDRLDADELHYQQMMVQHTPQWQQWRGEIHAHQSPRS